MGWTLEELINHTSEVVVSDDELEEAQAELTQLRREAAAFRWAAENGHLADLTSRRLDGTMETPLEAIEEAAKEWE